MQTRVSLIEFESTDVNPCLRLNKRSNSHKLSLVFAPGYINTGGNFLFLKYNYNIITILIL